MANERIPDLAPDTGLAGTTLFEDVNIGAGVSQKVALSAIATWLSNNFSQISLSGGTIALNADGSIKFANGVSTLNANGTANFVSGRIVFNVDGSVSFANGLTSFDNSGGANLAGGDFTIDGASGSVNIGGGAILLNSDGSTSLGSGTITTDSNGNFNASGNFTAQGAVSTTLGYYVGAVNVVDASGNYILGATNVVKGLFLTTSNATATATFNANGQNETIYDSGSSTITALTINLPTVTLAGQIVRYVTKAVVTTVTVTGTVLIGTAITTFAANSSVAWQAVNTTGSFIRLE